MLFGKKIKIKTVCMSALIFGGLVACSSALQQPSKTKIVNGLEVDQSTYPAVVFLATSTGRPVCTGTFIAPDTVLTAAHCTMMSKDVDDQTFKVNSLILNVVKFNDTVNKTFTTLATSTAIFRNPMWDKLFPTQIINKYDIAIIKFPANSSEFIAELAPNSPSAGDKFTIVGFGINYLPTKFETIDRSSAGIKRLGHNSIDAIEGGLIRYHGKTTTTGGDGVNASASKGDSGGPMFVKGKLAGVISGGGKIPLLPMDGLGFAIDINTPEAQQLLQKSAETSDM